MGRHGASPFSAIGVVNKQEEVARNMKPSINLFP